MAQTCCSSSGWPPPRAEKQPAQQPPPHAPAPQLHRRRSTPARSRRSPTSADSPNPRDPRAYPAAAKLALARPALVGPPLAWQTEPCATWPAAAAKDRYAGPWNRPTASTILVLGNTGDPTKTYHGSRAMPRGLAAGPP